MKNCHVTITTLILTILLLISPMAMAQDEDAEECDLEATIAKYSQTFSDAQDWNTLATLVRELQSTIAACNGGYIWSGYGDSLLGPVELEKGVYVLEYESSIDIGENFNYFNVHLTSVADENESERYIVEDDIQADSTREGEIIKVNGGAPLQLNGGKYLFQLDLLNYRDWTVKLYKVD